MPDVLITFDGGTSCNIPRLGYGEGYGSYQISDRPIVRVTFGKGHSSNSAELRTLIAALNDLYDSDPKASLKHIHIKGDSQIALKWVHCRKQPSKRSSTEFIEAIGLLRAAALRFSRITTQWHGRQNSVDIFGH